MLSQSFSFFIGVIISQKTNENIKNNDGLSKRGEEQENVSAGSKYNPPSLGEESEVYQVNMKVVNEEEANVILEPNAATELSDVAQSADWVNSCRDRQMKKKVERDHATAYVYVSRPSG